MKLPKLPKLPQLKKLFTFTRKTKLHASAVARRGQPIEDDYDSAEPQTKLSTAFVVVAVLHLVAVGGIYAFSSIKAHRKEKAPAVATALPSPTAAPATPRATAGPANSAAALSPVSGLRIHHVKSGDTLTKIASQYSVALADLEEANGAKNVAVLKPGQVLNIPAKRAPVAAKKPEAAPTVSATTKASVKTYVVAKGDNPVGIAKKLNVSYAKLLKLNNIEDPKKLKIGTTLKVPPGEK